MHIAAATPAYLVAAGRVNRKNWYVVAFEDGKGRVCYATEGFFDRDRRCYDNVGKDVQQLGGRGINDDYQAVGLAPLEARRVAIFSDTGDRFDAVAVRPGRADYRFFVATTDRQRSGASGVGWIDAGGALHRSRGYFVPDGVSHCVNADPPLTGDPEQLPRAGDTAAMRVHTIAERVRDQLAASGAALKYPPVTRVHHLVVPRGHDGRVVVVVGVSWLVQLLCSFAI